MTFLLIYLEKYLFFSFMGIIAGLRALHSNNSYHDNLLHGVTVSNDYKVKLFHISVTKGNDGKLFHLLIELVL